MLADFLREIRDIARVQKQIAEERRARVFAASGSQGGGSSGVRRSESKLTMSSSLGRNTDDRDRLVEESEEVAPEDEREEEWEGKGSGIWIPGQGVAVHYEEIVEILLRHVAYPSALSSSWPLEPILMADLESLHVQTRSFRRPYFTGCLNSSSSPRRS